MTEKTFVQVEIIRPSPIHVFTEQAPTSEVSIQESGSQGPKGDAGEGMDNYTGDPLAYYILAKS